MRMQWGTTLAWRGTTMRASSIAAVGVVFFASAVTRVDAQTNPIPTGTIPLKLDIVATLNTALTGAPNWGANAGDSRLFVVGQSGRAMIVDNGGVAGTFLDIPAALGSGVLLTGGETGFLGAAFHPDFANSDNVNGYRKFYTYTSENPGTSITNAPTFTHSELGAGNGSHQSVIREWTLSESDPNLIDTSLGSRVLMRIRQPQTNHNGGAIVFDNNGYLLVALGDGGGGYDAGSSNSLNSGTDGHSNSPGTGMAHGNAQDLTNVYGKILRIKPTLDADANTTLSLNGNYRIPNNNAFFGATPGLDEIFAYGLRNPFRLSVDSDTGKVYAADVGQGQREEVNLIVNGGNYGWVIKEGTLNTPFPTPNTGLVYNDPGNLVAPIGEYTHAQGVAVIGGFVYRGDKIPALQGKYVFGELNGPGAISGRLFYMNVNSPGPNTIFEFPIDPLGDLLPNQLLHGFGEGATGELYALFSNGQVVELTSSVIPGDFDGDTDVDGADFVVWQTNFPQTGGATLAMGDANADGNVDGADFAIWQTHFPTAPSSSSPSVPEPASVGLMLLAIVSLFRHRYGIVRG
jgi:glucose/arabinose dehydrogenase